VLAGGVPYPGTDHGGVTDTPVPPLDLWWVAARTRGTHPGAATGMAVALAATGALALGAAVAGTRRRVAGTARDRPPP